MLSGLTDEDFNGRILDGVRRVLPDVDIVRVQDTPAAECDDATILEFAAAVGRVLLTHDARTMPTPAYDRIAKGLPMPGVIIVPQSMRFRRAIDDLVLLIACSNPAECRDRVQRLPLT